MTTHTITTIYLVALASQVEILANECQCSWMFEVDKRRFFAFGFFNFHLKTGWGLEVLHSLLLSWYGDEVYRAQSNR
eukprot:SAG31_NODE_16_length_36206_cov_27.355728_10_plen_77_part_00